MKKQQHFMPLFFGDFLAATAEWAGEEQALYLLLLGHQWALESLPADVEKLRRLVRWEKKSFAAAWETVRSKFSERDGRLYNERLEQHRDRVNDISKKRADAGSKGGAKRHSNGEANAQQLDSNSQANATVLLRIPIQSNPEEDLHTGHSARASGLSDEAEHARFEQFRAAYPKFAGRANWIMAEQHYRMRLETGTAAADLQQAAERYAAFVAAGGVSSTGFVLKPETFLSAPDRPWQQAWDPPVQTPRVTPKHAPFVAPPDEPETARA